MTLLAGPSLALAQQEAAPIPPSETEHSATASIPEPPADEPDEEPESEPAEEEPEPELERERDRDRDDPQSEDVVEQLGDVVGQIGDALRPEPEPTTRVRWDPSWHRYRFDELVVTAGAGLVIGLEELLPTRTDANWQAVSNFDRVTARGLGLDDPVARDAIEEVTDGLAAALFIWPVAVDSLLYAGLGEGAWDVAWQLSLISLEVFAINHALTVMVRLLARRERPLGNFCRTESGYNADPVCRDQPPAESFWSAHVSNAFAGAALMCMYHDVLDLYGDEGADFAMCGAGLAAAVTTGVFRIMSDYEWVTDVLTGAVVGSLSGILIPWLLHFQGGARPPLDGQDVPAITFYPMVGDGLAGAGIVSTW